MTRLSIIKYLTISIICFGLFIAACQTQPTTVQEITFSKDIAPLFHRTCAPCHMPDGPAPFSLISYNEIAPKHKLIREVITKRIMPPWPADPSYSHFANELYLTDEQIAMFEKWIKNGMQKGDTTIVFNTQSLKKELHLGEPDMVVKVPRIQLKGNNEDLFLMMKIPVEFPQDTYIRAIEFVPGNIKLLHHVNTHLIIYDEENKKILNTGKAYVNQDQSKSTSLHQELGLLNDDGTYPPMTPSVSNYLPGALFSFYPAEIGGYRVKKKSAFYLNDLHYGPTPIEAQDSSYYKIYFSSKPPIREVKEFQMGTLGVSPVVPELIVPPGKIKKFTIQTIIKDDISLVSIVPHMHLIGKSFWAYAVKPSGDTIPLIRINNWDFRWQYFYQFKTLLKIPRGTTIYVEGVYDNSADNPNNPFSPPREIREREGSMKTTDEMFQLIITYVPYQSGDEQISLENVKP
jgi:hypothetical protein